jgi:hypothetical protein
MKALTPDVSHLRAFSGAAGNPLGTTRLSAMQHIACTKHAAPQSTRIRVWLRVGEDAMTYTIHALKDAQSLVSVRISPAAAVDKARLLESLGWQVHMLTQPDAGSSFQSLISSFGSIEKLRRSRP